MLFCDLVGYTALCERLDPEDADRLLRDFSAATRRAIENYGGLVEKFIGDAAVGVFGVPAGREDDAERAVRVALRLRDEIPLLSRVADVELSARIGINTGLAVVRHDAATRAGEGFLVGDAVNTAARFQQLAPPGGIVVGKTTCELTEDKILYERLPAAALKGKRLPVPCFLVRGPVSRRGIDVQHRFAAPLVDREVESGILRGLLEKAIASSRPQFGLIVGEAGIGKSRLVAEFFRYVENQPKLVRWRQGNCPAYGEGLAFRAIGEIAKQQLGVLDSDDGPTIEDKLGRGLAAMAEPEWLAARLRPLLGLLSVPVSREENYAAWGRFLASLAVDMPAVLVFEDLHNASESTLDFLFHLIGHAAEVPLLVLGTARPEKLADHHETVVRSAELVNARRLLRIDLLALSGGETGELVDHLLGDQVPSPETRRAVTDRAAGNPLFAEQLAFHVRSQVLSADPAEPGSGTKGTVSASLPASLQTLVAARLDQLSPEEKIVLGDAAVVGQVFWTGAIAALDHGDRDAAEQRLVDLTRRDLVYPETDSTLAGETQFAFHHALIREVAYGQLTRAERAAKHAAVAHWIETTIATDEASEIVAYHYVSALELAEAASDHGMHAALLGPTLQALKLAGDHALSLDAAAAEAHFARAVRLAADDTGSLRPGLLASWGIALTMQGRLVDAARILEEGAETLRALGAKRQASTAMVWLSRALMRLNDKRAADVSADAVAVLEGDGHSPELLEALAQRSLMCVALSDPCGALQAAERAVRIAEKTDHPQDCHLLLLRACARCFTGDLRAGLEDLRRATELLASPSTDASAQPICAELTSAFLNVGDGLSIQMAGLDKAEARHDESTAAVMRLMTFENLVLLGRWDEAACVAAPLEEFHRASGQTYSQQDAWSIRALLFVLQGKAHEAQMVVGGLGIRSGTLITSPIAFLAQGATQHALGQVGAARSALEHLFECTRTFCAYPKLFLWWPLAVRLSLSCHDDDLTDRLARRLIDSPAPPGGARATVEGLDAVRQRRLQDAVERFTTAGDCWHEQGMLFEHAQALLWRGRCLLELDQGHRAEAALTEARDAFARLGARPALADASALLQSAPSGGADARLR